MNSELICTGMVYRQKNISNNIIELTFYYTADDPTSTEDILLNNGPYPTILVTLAGSTASTDDIKYVISNNNILTVTRNESLPSYDTVVFDIYESKFTAEDNFSITNLTPEIGDPDPITID